MCAKKDRPAYVTAAYLKNNDTDILPHSFKKKNNKFSAQFKTDGILLPLIQSENKWD